MPLSLAAIILTKNEERDLPACLDSLIGIAAELYVVDSGSTDRTIAIAEERGARVLAHAFHNYATQFNWALSNIGSSCDWVVRIDADERLSDELRDELQRRLPGMDENIGGLMVPLRIRFLGRDLRWGDTYPVWLLRFLRRGAGVCENAWMDEHLVVSRGVVERLEGDLIHEIPKSLAEWTAKHNWYADRECLDMLGDPDRKDMGASHSLAGPSAKRRWLKRNLYGRSPILLRAFLFWFYRYFLKLGFLDGRPGLIYHFLQGFWYRFLVDAKLYEKHYAERCRRQSGGSAPATRKAKPMPYPSRPPVNP